MLERCNFSNRLEVISVDSNSSNTDIVIDAAPILSDCHLGDSIAVNGTCLTVTEFDSAKFKVGVSAETLRRTNLGELKPGAFVNLERAISSEVRFGGHYVQGHVDGTAELVSRVPDTDDSIVFTFKLLPQYLKYVVEKGFICIDGTSLTVTAVDYQQSTFSIMMVVYTQTRVILPNKAIGASVNIEIDVSAKVIEQQVEIQLQGQMNNPDSPLVKLIERIVTAKLEK